MERLVVCCPTATRVVITLNTSWRFRAVAATLSAIALVACSPSVTNQPAGDGDVTNDVPAVDEETRHRVAAIMRSPQRISVGEDHEGLALQRSILDDAWVTFAEYEQVMRAATDCIETEGFPVSNFGRWPEEGVVGPPIGPGINPTVFFLWIYIDIDDPNNLLGTVEDRCRTQWSYWVEEAWELQHAPSIQEQQAWLDRLGTCMREKGLPVSSPPSDLDSHTGILEAGCRPWESD